MAQTVFVLGAGTSADARVPLMDNFMETARELASHGGVPSRNTFGMVFEAVDMLPQVHSKAMLNIDNVESVFSAFEMAKIIGVLGRYSSKEINSLYAAMSVVIAETIEATMVLPVIGNQEALPPPPYSEFVEMLRRLRWRVVSSSDNSAPVALITFNYDLALDYACSFASLETTYALPGDQDVSSIPLLKLHGSLNWGTCNQCGMVRFRKVKKLKKPDEDSAGRLFGSHWARLKIADLLKDLRHHKKPVNGPLIVPPTWGKASYHVGLPSVWGRAARELANAENIIVIGYSLPPSDAFFKYLYALGTLGQSRIRRFWVFNPDDSVKSSFYGMLGPGVQPKFRFFGETFASSIPLIASELRAG